MLRVADVKVKIRYLSHDVARHIGSSKKKEVVRLSDNDMYELVVGLLEESIGEPPNSHKGEKSKGKTLDTLILLCEGKTSPKDTG